MLISSSELGGLKEGSKRMAEVTVFRQIKKVVYSGFSWLNTIDRVWHGDLSEILARVRLSQSFNFLHIDVSTRSNA
jgi:hypothetical protein